MKRNLLLVLLLISTAVFAGKPAKYVFLMIGDGMGPEFCRLYMSQYPDSNFSKFAQRIPTGTNNIYGKTTDSAASGTALACGIKTYNTAIGVNKSKKPVTSLAKKLKEQNWKIGIISSVGINDATPAAHYANQITRKERGKIITDMFASKFDFFGVSTFLSQKEYKNKDISKHLKKNGYTVVKGKQLAALKRMVVKYQNQLIEPENVCRILQIEQTPEAPAESAGTAEDTAELLNRLGEVKEWAAPEKKGRFTFDDRKFFQSLDKQYKEKKSLSDKQLAALKKLADKYLNN